MHAKLALTIALLSHGLASGQTSNPGGPVQSISSATDQTTTGVLSIQTDTVTSGTTVSVTSGSETGSTTTESSSSSATSSAPSSSASDAGAASPRETGYALAAAAAGLIGVFAAL
ncbi:uncharacterized protein F4807DRAFT_431738 [Annulohypoxylon truncatum]|uniref:uncharacterized protein n=1 Tax=Annulohypoxylon truncatum TaxID=327061 RepID=UPI002007C969|nr:uncharacterized protein F4807DRAFT_431738 [Annulohypoxylon truncatum]KAI1208139.1 hypothetical protein F4807DRAFT_431738 [Annulohypoxylon truncatum]